MGANRKFEEYGNILAILWEGPRDPENHRVLKLLMEGFAKLSKLERENDLGPEDAMEEPSR